MITSFDLIMIGMGNKFFNVDLRDNNYLWERLH